MNYPVLLGIAIVIVGFALKLDSILTIVVLAMTAIGAIVTHDEDIRGNLGTTH